MPFFALYKYAPLSVGVVSVQFWELGVALAERGGRAAGIVDIAGQPKVMTSVNVLRMVLSSFVPPAPPRPASVASLPGTLRPGG